MAKGRQRDEWSRFSELIAHVANGPSRRRDGRSWVQGDFIPASLKESSAATAEVLSGGDFIDRLNGVR